MSRTSASIPHASSRPGGLQRLLRWLFPPLFAPAVRVEAAPPATLSRISRAAPDEPVFAAMATALHVAHARRHARCGAPHILLALVECESVRELLQHAGMQTSQVVDAAEILLAGEPAAAGSETPGDGRMAELLEEAVVMRTRVRATTVRAKDLFIDVLRAEEGPRAVFAEHGVTLVRLRVALVELAGHPVTSDEDVLDAEPACVVVHDDEFASQQFILSACVAGLGITAVKAAQLTQVVFQHGRAAVLGFTFAAARQAAKRAEEHARSQEMPLRFTAHRASGAEQMPGSISR